MGQQRRINACRFAARLDRDQTEQNQRKVNQPVHSDNRPFPYPKGA
jgi:hypothetical protein